MNILVTICARGGSKGIPGKNIKPLAGKPLIGYSIEMAKTFASKYNADIALSTDGADIRATAANLGLHSSYERPAALASDTAGKIAAIRDLLEYEEARNGRRYDYLLDLDVTSPLRTLEDIERAFELIKGNEQALTLFSVNNAARNPYFNMVEEQANGFVDVVKRLPGGAVLSRQQAPNVYDINGSLYWYRRAFFDSGLTSVTTNRSLVYVMDHLCFDLDHPIDFEFMEYLVLKGETCLAQ